MRRKQIALTPGYFFRPPFFLPWLYTGLTWRVPSDSKVLYLTFDDGPVHGPTEYILDRLEASKVQATFFCIGNNIKKNPAVFRRIVNEGHAIGNHTFHHLNGWKASGENYLTDALMCDEQIGIHTDGANSRTKLFRPPYGRITWRQMSALSSFKIIMWDVLTNDYAKNLSPENCLRGAIGATRPGSIIVFHDSYKAEKNMTYVLPRYLDHFLGLGYSFKRLS